MSHPHLPAISEKEFQAQVIEFAHHHGWNIAHFRPARTAKGWRTAVSADGNGFPDLVLLRDRIIYAELKSEKGILWGHQDLWRKWIVGGGGEWYCWRPGDWKDIERILGKE